MTLPIPYYQDDWCTIYHGDCRDILPLLEPVDLVLTDPPYSDATAAGARTRKGEIGRTGGAELVSFSISESELRIVLSLVAVRLRRWCVLFCDWRHAASFGNIAPEGLRHVRFGIWDKPNGSPQFTGDRPAPGWEAISILHAIGGKLRWNGGGTRSVWRCNVEHQNGHPTPKPVALMAEMVTLFSDKLQTVLDPFMGSGTTLVAAKQLGRRAIGIEIEEKYCAIAVKRLQQEVLPFAPKPAQPKPEQLEI